MFPMVKWKKITIGVFILLNFKNLDVLIDLALSEDLGSDGDVTGNAIFSEELYSFRLISKDEGILCGIDVFEYVFHRIDKDLKIKKFSIDGNKIRKGDIISEVSGKVSSILAGERTALNFISHLSAIATKTSIFVEEAAGKVKILDTRKTLPGYRELHKYAVRCGGGQNHRMGLFDMVMIKDNHIDAAGGITQAVDKVRARWGNKYKIEVETRNLQEVKEAIAAGADIIMLDNMDDETMKKAVELINKKALVEASGNMTLERIKSVAQTGVDFISFGELTNSVKAFDFSLKEVK